MKTKPSKASESNHGGARPGAGRPKTVPAPATPSEPASPGRPIDPIAVLESIAVDRLTPATARVNACKVLLAHRAAAGAKPTAPADTLSQRAIEIMSRGGRSLQ